MRLDRASSVNLRLVLLDQRIVHQQASGADFLPSSDAASVTIKLFTAITYPNVLATQLVS